MLECSWSWIVGAVFDNALNDLPAKQSNRSLSFAPLCFQAKDLICLQAGRKTQCADKQLLSLCLQVQALCTAALDAWVWPLVQILMWWSASCSISHSPCFLQPTQRWIYSGSQSFWDTIHTKPAILMWKPSAIIVLFVSICAICAICAKWTDPDRHQISSSCHGVVEILSLEPIFHSQLGTSPVEREKPVWICLIFSSWLFSWDDFHCDVWWQAVSIILEQVQGTAHKLAPTLGAVHHIRSQRNFQPPLLRKRNAVFFNSKNLQTLTLHLCFQAVIIVMIQHFFTIFRPYFTSQVLDRCMHRLHAGGFPPPPCHGAAGPRRPGQRRRSHGGSADGAGEGSEALVAAADERGGGGKIMEDWDSWDSWVSRLATSSLGFLFERLQQTSTNKLPGFCGRLQHESVESKWIKCIRWVCNFSFSSSTFPRQKGTYV